jgi:hypothetical protein
MDKSQLEQLITSSGLNLLSDHTPRFLVSLRVGLRIQTAAITFGTQQAFLDATVEQTQVAINEAKKRLQQAAKTKQGDIAHKDRGEIRVETTQKVVSNAAQINYPAH